jgi:hypothetical protein
MKGICGEIRKHRVPARYSVELCRIENERQFMKVLIFEGVVKSSLPGRDPNSPVLNPLLAGYFNIQLAV